MSIFINFWWVYNWSWVFRKAIWRYVTRTIRILIYCTSQASRTMSVTEYAIYYMNGPYTAVGKAGEVKPWQGFESERHTNPQALGWVNKGEQIWDTVVGMQKGIRIRWEVSGRPLTLGICSRASGSQSRATVHQQGQKSGKRTGCQEKSEDNLEPSRQLSFWQQRPPQSKQSCCLTPGEFLSHELPSWPALPLSAQGKEFWAL